MFRRALGGAATTALIGGMAGPAVAEEINVYSSRHYDTDVALYEDFTKQTKIEVNLIEAEADELIERIRAEAANSPADVVITVDAGRLWRAEEAGILQPVESGTLNERIPESLRHPEGLWFGLSKRVRAIIYSKERVDPSEISTYEDLAEDAWEGRVCVRSSSNIYNQSLVASMIATEGAEAAETWARGLVENLARPPQGGDRDQIRAVAAGECDVAISNHYYFVQLMKSEDTADQQAAEAVDILFPNQGGRGTHANVSGAGVAANAPNKEGAIAFLEYLTTEEAQRYFSQGNYEFPVVEGVELDPVLAEWGEFKTDTVNAAEYGRHNPQAVMLMDRVGWP